MSRILSNMSQVVNNFNQLKQPQLKFREVFVETPDYAGLGDTYEHPPRSQLDYNNPVTTIYHIDSSRARLYFGTKDGQVGKIKQSKNYLFGVI